MLTLLQARRTDKVNGLLGGGGGGGGIRCSDGWGLG